MRLAKIQGLGAYCAVAVLACATPLKAECTKLFYSVNDYGKEGPTRDAQALLDKYIENWAKEKGIKKYKVGKKEVSCELFLDVVLFDEHTCKATADVCWTPAKPGKRAEAAPPKPVRPASAQ